MTSKLEIDAPPMSGHAVQTGYDLFYELAKTSFDNALSIVDVEELRVWFEGRGYAYGSAAQYLGAYIDQSYKDEVDKLNATYKEAYLALREEAKS
jgi:hypothetical protein